MNDIAVGRTVSVEGEVSGYTVSNGKWIFFDLKDEQGKIGCFAAALNLSQAFEDGMQIVVHYSFPKKWRTLDIFSSTLSNPEFKVRW